MDEERTTGGRSSQPWPAREPHRNPPETDEARLVSGQAWSEFCDRLKTAGEHVLAAGTPAAAAERAEGFRYLATLAAAGIRHGFELADPDLPRFLRNPDSRSKWGAENADNGYLLAGIRSDASYRITGRRGSVHAFLVEVKEGYMQLGKTRNFASLASDAIVFEPDGSFEILLSRDPHPGNWLPLHPEATQVLIRQFFYDWNREQPAEFRIARIGAEGEPPAALEAYRVARQLDDAACWIETTARVWNEWVAELRANAEPNVIVKPTRYVGGADDILYSNNLYVLEREEALVIETVPPGARYWGLQLVNLWFESRDYANRETSVNGHQAHIDGDGKFRAVVAHEDPGVPNWLDAGGLREGILQYRCVWASTCPTPTARVVALSALPGQLPADTPRVDRRARRERVRARQDHVARRERFG